MYFVTNREREEQVCTNLTSREIQRDKFSYIQNTCDLISEAVDDLVTYISAVKGIRPYFCGSLSVLPLFLAAFENNSGSSSNMLSTSKAAKSTFITDKPGSFQCTKATDYGFQSPSNSENCQDAHITRLREMICLTLSTDEE